MPERIKVFFDGGCRPNPGTMEVAVFAGGQSFVEPDLGYGTSEDAEWLALIEALRVARTLELTDFVLLGDAAAVIGPAIGKVKCRGSAVPHRQALLDLAGAAGLPHIRYIKRAQNLAGIALARLHGR